MRALERIRGGREPLPGSRTGEEVFEGSLRAEGLSGSQRVGVFQVFHVEQSYFIVRTARGALGEETTNLTGRK